MLLQDHARLSQELRIGRVDEEDTRHGGGFKELSSLTRENDELEQAIDCCESLIYHDVLELLETVLDSLDAKGCIAKEREKLARYAKTFRDNPDDGRSSECDGGAPWL